MFSSVELSINGEVWREVSDFTTSTATDQVFTLDGENGHIRFGDGEHGQIPPSGARIIITYETGGGKTGNVPHTLRLPAVIKIEPFKRVRYFQGQLLSAKDFEDEQSYLLKKQRLQNRLLLGAGVVSGLEVTAGSDGIHVQPGIAIDRLGREIMLPNEAVLPLHAGSAACSVVIRYVEKETDPIPVAGDDNGVTEDSRIEESYAIGYADNRRDGEDVILAKLMWQDGRWDTCQPCCTSRCVANCAIVSFCMLLFLWIFTPHTSRRS